MCSFNGTHLTQITSGWILIGFGNSRHENSIFDWLQKRFVPGEAFAFLLRLNIGGTSLSHIELQTYYAFAFRNFSHHCLA
ncbi:MAG: hypothetical protein DMF44_07295, partial [Verrucomicrobia bacterium]